MSEIDRQQTEFFAKTIMKKAKILERKAQKAKGYERSSICRRLSGYRNSLKELGQIVS